MKDTKRHVLDANITYISNKRLTHFIEAYKRNARSLDTLKAESPQKKG